MRALPPAVHRTIVAVDVEVALIASNRFFDEAIRHPPGCAPAARPQVTVAGEQTRTTA